MSKKKYIVGLDVGTSSIKLAQFRLEDGVGQLIAVRSIELTKDKGLSAAIKEILSGIDLPHTRFVTLFNTPQAMVKRIVVPPMPQAELKDALALEAKNYFPFPVTDCLIDFEIVGEVWEKEVKKIELLLAVCPHQAIKEHLVLLSQAGIQPERILHPSLSLFSLLKLRNKNADTSIAALDIGKDVSDLIIVRNNKLVFSRKIPLAGDDFTKALTATLFSASGKVQLSYEEAERIKKQYGMAEAGISELIENKLTASQILSLLRPLAEKLSYEIERSFDFYREESQGERVGLLLLAGGSAQLKGLDKILLEALGIGVEVLHSLEGIDMAGEAVGKDIPINRIAMAVGAGVDRPSGINLLPQEVKQEMLRLVRRATIKAMVSGSLTILFLIFIGLRLQAANLDKKIAGAKFQLQALSKQLGDTQNWGLLSDILKGQVYGEDILKEISNLIPVGICLKSISLQDRAIEIRGIVASSYSLAEGLISGFIRSLEAGIFKNVTLQTIQEAGGIREFRLKMEME